MGEFIGNLGDILNLWAIKFVKKMHQKPKFWVLGDIFLEHSYRSPEKKTFFDSAKRRLFEDDSGPKSSISSTCFLFLRRMGRGA